MIGKLIISNVLHRPVRTFISVLAVSLEVIMVLLVVGMTTGMVEETAKRVEGIGAEIMVQPPGASYFLALSQAPMPIKIADKLAEQPRVMAVTPVLFLFNVTGGTANLIYGIDIDSFNRVSRGFVFHDGGYFENPYDVMVDDIYAKAKNIEVGQLIPLVNHEFRVSGIVEHGKGSRIFIPLATAQDLSGSKGKAAIFYVRLTDPSYTDMVETRFQEMLPRHEIRPIKEYMDLMTSNNLPALNSFLTVMVIVAMSLGFLVIFLSLYTTIMERTREIGILKSLGASKRYIMTIVLRETAFMCAAGIVAGWAGTVMAKQMINEFFPQIAIHLSVEWALWAALLAMTGGLLGGIYPAVKAAQADPVDALAYE